MTQPETGKRWMDAAGRFFNLENTKAEWALFCHLNALDEKLKSESRFARWRQQIFFLLLWEWSTSDECWFRRLEEWQSHLDVYFGLADRAAPAEGFLAGSIGRSSYGTRRIDHLFGHLGVLDTKFGMLLSVNAAMLGAFTFLLTNISKLLDYVRFPVSKAGVLLNVGFELFFYLLLLRLIVLSLFNLWHILRGFRRIVWGDLNGFEGNPEGGEQAQTDCLIISIARRTNVFRIVADVTKRIYFGLVVFATVALLLLGLRYVRDLEASTHLLKIQWTTNQIQPVRSGPAPSAPVNPSVPPAAVNGPPLRPINGSTTMPDRSEVRTGSAGDHVRVTSRPWQKNINACGRKPLSKKTSTRDTKNERTSP